MVVLNPTWPVTMWQAAFNADPNSSTPPLWDDLSATVTAWDTKVGRQYELGQQETGTANVSVDDPGETLNPLNGSSPYNSGGKRVDSYRQNRCAAMWPHNGNIINDTNLPYWGVGAASSGFEDGTIGAWTVSGAGALALTNSTVRAHDGSHSLQVAYTSGGAGAWASAAYLALPPVRVAIPYTVSAWVWVPTSGTGVALQVVDLYGNVIVTGSPSSTTNAWARISVPLTPTLGGLALQVGYPGTPSGAQTVWVDSVQMEQSQAVNAYTTTGPTVYPVVDQFIERYPETWQAQGYRGMTDFTSIDALGLLPRCRLGDIYTAECSVDLPAGFWLLDDASTATAAADTGLVGLGAMVGLKVGSAGSGGGLGDSTLPLGVDAQASYKAAPTSSTDYWEAYADFRKTQGSGYSIGGGIVEIGNGATVEAWVRTTTVAQQTAVCVIRGVNSAQAWWDLGADSSGHAQTRMSNGSGAVSTTVAGTLPITDGRWHHLVATWYVTTNLGVANLTLYVDGAQVATTAATIGAPGLTAICAGALSPVTAWPFTGNPLTGNVARVGLYPTALAPARVTAHWRAGSDGWSGDRTGARVARLLSYVPWLGTTSIASGATDMGPAVGLAGTSVADAIAKCVTTEYGAFYADPTGRLVFTGRDARYLQTTSRWTFGEFESAYQADIKFELDPSFVGNDVTVTRDGGVPQRVVDSTSQTRYFPSTLQVQTQHRTDVDAQQLAEHLLGRYKTTHIRVTTITLRPSTAPSLWPVALGVAFGDRVTVKRRTSAGVTTSTDFFVDRIAHSVTEGAWLTTFELSPVEVAQAWILGDATYGVLGSTTVLEY